MAKSKNNGGLDGLVVVIGFMSGVVAGGFILLLRTALKSQIMSRPILHTVKVTSPVSEPTTLADPIARNHAEGKAAAYRRQAELGITS